MHLVIIARSNQRIIATKWNVVRHKPHHIANSHLHADLGMLLDHWLILNPLEHRNVRLCAYLPQQALC